MVNKEEILQFSGLPNLRYPNNIVDSDKEIFDFYLSQTIPNMEIKSLNNVLVSPYGTIYRNFSVLNECTPYYFEPAQEDTQYLMKSHIDAGGVFGGSIERFIRHFVVFKKTNINKTCFWCSDQYSYGYYHWLCETLPRIYLLTLLPVKNPTVILPGPTMKDKMYIKESLNLLFPDIDFLFTQSRNMLKLKELTWISRMGKVDPCQFNPRLMASFRKFVRGIVKEDNVGCPKKRLYISRKNASLRSCSNENEVESLVKKFGFEAVCFEDYSFEEKIKICGQSEIMIGMYGAGLSHMIFMPDDSFILDLRFRTPEASNIFSLANALSFNYYYLFCKYDTGKMDDRGDNDNVDLQNKHQGVQTRHFSRTRELESSNPVLVDLSALEQLLDNMVSTCEEKKNVGTSKSS
jgi:capsular polysaccharide biosynthesis protein